MTTLGAAHFESVSYLCRQSGSPTRRTARPPRSIHVSHTAVSEATSLHHSQCTPCRACRPTALSSLRPPLTSGGNAPPLPASLRAQSSAGQNSDNGGALMTEGVRVNAGGVAGYGAAPVRPDTLSGRHAAPPHTGGAREEEGTQTNPRSDMDKFMETPTTLETWPQVSRGAWRCVAAPPCHVLGPHVFARPSCVHRVPRPAPAAPRHHGHALGGRRGQARRGSPVLPLRSPRLSKRLLHLYTQRC